MKTSLLIASGLCLASCSRQGEAEREKLRADLQATRAEVALLQSKVKTGVVVDDDPVNLQRSTRIFGDLLATQNQATAEDKAWFTSNVLHPLRDKLEAKYGEAQVAEWLQSATRNATN